MVQTPLQILELSDIENKITIYEKLKDLKDRKGTRKRKASESDPKRI